MRIPFQGTNLLMKAALSLNAPLVPKQIKGPAPSRSPVLNGSHKFPGRLCGENSPEPAIEILCQQKRLKEATQLLDQCVRPSANIYSSLLKLCLEQGALEEGKGIHLHMNKSGFKPGTVICNRLIDLYAKCNSFSNAQLLFDSLKERDLCSWNIMLAGYARIGELDNARCLFERMPEKDNHSCSTIMSGYVRHSQPKVALGLYYSLQKDGCLKDNKFTVSSALAASAAIPSLRSGKEIHCHILRTGFSSDEIVWSALSDMYAKCGSIEGARFVFDELSEKDVVSWTTMIGRYLEGGRMKEGLELFEEMLRSGA